MDTLNNKYRTNRYTEAYIELFNGIQYQVVARKHINVTTINGENIISVNKKFIQSHKNFFIF